MTRDDVVRVLMLSTKNALHYLLVVCSSARREFIYSKYWEKKYSKYHKAFGDADVLGKVNFVVLKFVRRNGQVYYHCNNL